MCELTVPRMQDWLRGRSWSRRSPAAYRQLCQNQWHSECWSGTRLRIRVLPPSSHSLHISDALFSHCGRAREGITKRNRRKAKSKLTKVETISSQIQGKTRIKLRCPSHVNCNKSRHPRQSRFSQVRAAIHNIVNSEGILSLDSELSLSKMWSYGWSLPIF